MNKLVVWDNQCGREPVPSSELEKGNLKPTLSPAQPRLLRYYINAYLYYLHSEKRYLQAPSKFRVTTYIAMHLFEEVTTVTRPNGYLGTN